MKRPLMLILVLALSPCGQVFAEIEVLRDSIGCDANGDNCTSTLTDGLAGSSVAHAGGTWATPGMVVDVPNTGLLNQAQIVIFAGMANGQPENDLANILGYYMKFHVWSDGVQGGPDSFYDNAIGHSSVPGHIEVDVNTSTESFITAEEFGITGPSNDPDLFTSFLITIDLSSFAIELQGGQQYVVGVEDPGGNFITGGGTFRHQGSRSTGFEDLYQQDDTLISQLPGFLSSQLFASYEQHAGLVSLENGDHDGDNDVDGSDFLKWQVGESAKPLSSFDLAAWQLNFGETLSPAVAATTVPEPSTCGLVLIGAISLLVRRRHRSAKTSISLTRLA